ncbi:hypothetical protein BHE74_00032463, partial [Ensete ventricosum]
LRDPAGGRPHAVVPRHSFLLCQGETAAKELMMENQEEEGEGGQWVAVERAFERQRVPPLREQLTMRALVVSFALSVMLSVVAMRLNLTAGIVPSLNASAGLLGFFFVKLWTKALQHAGLLRTPFTRQENTVIQTSVVAAYSLAFSGQFPFNCMDDRFVLTNSLRFYFDFSATYVGVGMICPYIVNLSLLLGAILSWGIMWPLISNQKGHWYPADTGKDSLNGLQGYRVISLSLSHPAASRREASVSRVFFVQVFTAVALILGDGLYNFLKILRRTTSSFISAVFKGLPISDDERAPKNLAISFDDERRTEVFVRDHIPPWVAYGCYVVIATLSIVTVPCIFPPLKWYHILVAHVFAPVFAFCNAYGCGLTDWNLASTYGKLAIFVFGAWAGADHGGVLAGLAACGLVMSVVATASDLMQNFRTGYLTLASPRSVFASQVIGAAMGCVIAPCVFWLFFKAFDDIGTPGSQYPAPNAIIYRNMAILGIDGSSSLPKHCLALCCVFFALAIAINFAKDVLPNKMARFIPIPMAIAIPFYIGPFFAIDMCIGSLILYVWTKMNKGKASAFGPAVASGLICGDGLWAVPQGALALAQVKPPMCMKFVHGE